MTVLEELASWAVATDAISEPAKAAARRVLMDQVGVSVAGGKPAPALRSGRPAATLWSTGQRVFAPDAALANRFAGDDLELTAGPEIGAASVAAAEVADRSFGDVFVAMTIASEIEQYLRGWLQRSVERNGLHPPAFFAASSAAAAASKLIGLSPESFMGALAAAWALTPLSPYSAFSEGASGKWLYGSFGQQLGVQCALWARAGIVGAASTLEGRRGIARALDGTSEPPRFEPKLDAISNVTFKAFPCSRACHPALTALEALGPLDPTRIARVEVDSYPFSVDLERRSTKRNAIASQMSISKTLQKALSASIPVEVRSLGDDTLPRRRYARVRVVFEDGSERRASAEAKWGDAAPATDRELRDRFEESVRGKPAIDPWHAPDDARVREAFHG